MAPLQRLVSQLFAQRCHVGFDRCDWLLVSSTSQFWFKNFGSLKVCFESMANSTISGLITVVKVLLYASLSVPMFFFLNQFVLRTQNHAAQTELITGAQIVILLSLFSIGYFLFRGTVKQQRDPFLYGFVAFSFFAVGGLLFALDYDGIFTGIIGDYVKSAESPTYSPFFAVFSYLNLGILVPLQLVMCYRIAARKSYRSVAIYWAAALLQSMTAVVVVSIFYGKPAAYSSTIRHTFLAIFPVVVGWNQLLTPSNIQITGNVKPKSILRRPLDLLFAILSAVSAFACFIRAMAVLKSPLWIAKNYGEFVEPHLVGESPTPFLSSQVLMDMFYHAPMFLICIYGLVKPGCTWLINIVLLLGGAQLMSPLLHILTSLHFNTPQALKPPVNPTAQAIFWAVNLTLLILPQLLVLRVAVCPSFFGSAAKESQKQTTVKSKPNVAAKKIPVTSTKNAPVVVKKQQNSVKKTDKSSKKAKQH